MPMACVTDFALYLHPPNNAHKDHNTAAELPSVHPAHVYLNVPRVLPGVCVSD